MFPMLNRHQPGTRPEITAVGGISAILLSWKRPSNVSKIVDELRLVPSIREIIVWNNNAELRLDVSNCKVINSSHNFMPFARYSAAVLAAESTILFQDDDMLFPKHSIERAFAEYLKDKTRIYGTNGRNLQDGKYNLTSVIGECDIILGQFMLFDKKLLISVFEKMLRVSPLERGDDIAFSLFCETKHLALGLEHEDLGMRDEFALHKQKGHGEKRQNVVDRVLDLKKRVTPSS
jgi:hypothetical protein